MNSTDRPVWLVTGAAGTLGSELVRQVIAGGSDCIALDRDEAGLNRLHDELAKSGQKPPALVPLDLIGAAPADYDKLAETMESEFRSARPAGPQCRDAGRTASAGSSAGR